MSRTNQAIEINSVSISGVKVSYTKSGVGAPSIVFLNGHRTPMSNWHDVVNQLDDVGTLLTYDRLDTGGSDKALSAQDGETIVARLNGLLEAVDVAPPYVLVSHSLGGLYANLYARTHPDKVGAFVFVEAAHPSEAEQQTPDGGAKTGFIGKLFTPEFKKNPNSEFNNVLQTVKQINAAAELPDRFVVVVTGGLKMPFVPKGAFAEHQRWQKEMAKLGSSGYQVIAEKSGHGPQASEPELVVQAIKDAIESLGTATDARSN